MATEQQSNVLEEELPLSEPEPDVPDKLSSSNDNVKDKLKNQFDEIIMKARNMRDVRSAYESLKNVLSGVVASLVMNRIKKYLGNNGKITQTLQKKSAAALDVSEIDHIFSKVGEIPAGNWQQFINSLVFSRIALKKTNICSDINEEDFMETTLMTQESQNVACLATLLKNDEILNLMNTIHTGLPQANIIDTLVNVGGKQAMNIQWNSVLDLCNPLIPTLSNDHSSNYRCLSDINPSKAKFKDIDVLKKAMGMIRTKLQKITKPRSGFYNESDLIDVMLNQPGYKDHLAIYVYLELSQIYKNYGWMLHTSSTIPASSPSTPVQTPPFIARSSSTGTDSGKKLKTNKSSDQSLVETVIDLSQSMKVSNTLQDKEAAIATLSRKIEAVGKQLETYKQMFNDESFSEEERRGYKRKFQEIEKKYFDLYSDMVDIN